MLVQDALPISDTWLASLVAPLSGAAASGPASGGPGGSMWHVESQPSPETVLPSSHCSVTAREPSPQTRITRSPEVEISEPTKAGYEKGATDTEKGFEKNE